MKSRPTVSIVLASYQRSHLLTRSLACYYKQDFPKEEVELVVVDDSSSDGTDKLVRNWSHDTGIRAVTLTPHPKTTGWRDCGAVLNYGIRASAGEFVLLTHPEVMPGRASVRRCVDALASYQSRHANLMGLYTSCRIYYLSPREQELLDTVDWYGKGPLAVRDIPRFYEDDVNGHQDFNHRSTDMVAQPGSRIACWHSWVFGGHSRETWKRLGGFLNSNEWGSCDVAWNMRRHVLGIPNHTCPEEDTICTHQNHDLPGDVITDRSESKWREELKGVDFSDPRKMRFPFVDELGW